MTSHPMHTRPLGSSQIASTCHHDIHYLAMHMYLIMCTYVTSHPIDPRHVGSSQKSTTCPQDIHYPTMHVYIITPYEEGPCQACREELQGQHNLLLGNHVLEPHCSPLHHIPDIVVFDLDMLRLVMEHRFSHNFMQLGCHTKCRASSLRPNNRDKIF
jgi:hypothetical protein